MIEGGVMKSGNYFFGHVHFKMPIRYPSGDMGPEMLAI